MSKRSLCTTIDNELYTEIENTCTGKFNQRIEELLRHGLMYEQEDHADVDTALKYIKRAGVVLQKLQQTGTDS